MRLSKSRPNGEAAHVEAAAQREAGQEAARVGAHVGARLVVVAYPYIIVRRGNDIGTKHKMAEKVALETVFQFRI